MLLKNKNAVVTGSNKGIGREILNIFSENGANIFACSRNFDDDFKSHINQLEKKNGNKITPIKLDFSNENQTKEAANNILSSESSIDILINNAATIYTALFQMT